MDQVDGAALRYDRRTIWLHWATAILVALQWLIGRLNGFLPKGPLRLDIWSIHVLLGFSLAALIVARIAWRSTGGRRLPPADRGARHVAALIVQGALYVMLVAVVALGIANVFGHGFPLFGVWKFPRFWDKPTQQAIGWGHDLSANIIAAVALIHAGAALMHRYWWRDGVLARMGIDR
jgi:cytochrome b561